MKRPHFQTVLPTLVVSLFAVTVSTQTVANSTQHGIPFKFESQIGGNSFSFSSSIFVINIGAGMRNSQAGANALALNPRGSSAAQVDIAQTRTGKSKVDIPFAYTGITDNAFHLTKGIVLMNQVSGADNSQANAVAIAVGARATAVTNTQLSATSAGAKSAPGDTKVTTGKRRVSLANTALRGAQGVVLINQTAGARNLSTNRFSLQMRTGGTR